MANLGYFEDLKRQWERLALTDPLWAALTDPRKAGGQWDIDQFLESGRREVDRVLHHVHAMGVTVDFAGPALDFGCGPGRLTQALGRHFEHVIGVDVSPAMVNVASRLSEQSRNCDFRINQSPDLSQFPSDAFHFVYSSLVLQHIQSDLALDYIREFARIAKPSSVVVFQLADSYLPREVNLRQHCQRLKTIIGLRTRLRAMREGLLSRSDDEAVDAQAMSDQQFEMHCLLEPTVRAAIASEGAWVLDVRLTNSTTADFNGELRYLDKVPRHGWIGKQYCCVKS